MKKILSNETPAAQGGSTVRGLHTSEPWSISILGGESQPAPEGLTDAQRERWNKIMADQRRPFRHNDGSFNIVAGKGDERFPVATAVLRVHKKRNQPHTIEDPEAEANAERSVACVNALAGVQNPAAIPQLISAAHRLLLAFHDPDFREITAALAALDSPQSAICPQTSNPDNAGRVSSTKT